METDVTVECLICDTREADHGVVSPGNSSVNCVSTLTKTTMSQVSVISIINNIISSTSSSQSVICSRCFNLLDTIDTLRVQLRFKKSEIVTLHDNKKNSLNPSDHSQMDITASTMQQQVMERHIHSKDKTNPEQSMTSM